MTRGESPDPVDFDATIDIEASPDAVHAAFFSAESLADWLGARASVTTPRPMGVYAVEWPTADDADPLLGPFGGAFYGMVIDVRPGRELFLADTYWMPPDGDPVGPMAVHLTCEPTSVGTRVRLHQGGCDDSPRWRRYYRVMGARWIEALARLKAKLEAPAVTPPAGS